MTLSEEKEKHLDVQRQLVMLKRRHSILLDIINLFYKYPHRYTDLSIALDELVIEYDMDDDDVFWLYMVAFHEYDIDLTDWLDHKLFSDLKWKG